MENEKELLEAKIKENEEAIERIQAKMRENERIMRETKRAMFWNKLIIIRSKSLIAVHNIWFKFWVNIKFLIKSPVVLIFLICLAIRSSFDENLRAMIMNIYYKRYNKEQMRVIIDHFNTIITHGTFIFYIILLAWRLYFY